MLDRVQARIPVNLAKTSRHLLPRSMIGAVRRPLVGAQARRWISCKYAKPPHLPCSSRGFPEAAPKVRSHTMIRVIWPLGIVVRRAWRTASMDGYTKKSEFILVHHGFRAHRVATISVEMHPFEGFCLYQALIYIYIIEISICLFLLISHRLIFIDIYIDKKDK